jgi:hypothetical protein
MRTVLAHGPGGIYDFLPVLFLGAAVYVIVTAMKDGQDKKPRTRTLPTNPLSRQMHAATRPPRSERSAASSSDRTARRFHPPDLQVVKGEADEASQSPSPVRFQPAPPSRRKSAS